MNPLTDIVRTIEEHWIAVTPGYLCNNCGHLHHGRQLAIDGSVVEHIAVTYGFCDQATCSCRYLRRKKIA
jgi:hypothetical protein